MTVLTLDLGTSSTKAALWEETQLVAISRTPIATNHPEGNRAEQDPEDWWRSVVDACAELRAKHPAMYSSIEALGCSAARETFACFDANLRAVGPGILWSDARAVDEARDLDDPVSFRRRTGVALGPSCCAAKMAWAQRHGGTPLRDVAWFLSPRDVVIAKMTGRVATEPTLASRTGVYDLRGTFIGSDALRERLPPVISTLEPSDLASNLELEIPRGAVAILGAGDRACEVIGVGATSEMPMLSWGTTANVSIPHPGPISALPIQGQVSRGAVDGFVVEAGLSIAGAALEWLSSLTARSRAELLTAGADVPPGAGGLLAFPWLYGARAPWWRPDVRGAFVGLANVHGPGELTRAVIEGVAIDVARCVELLCPDTQSLSIAGSGAQEQLWRTVVAALTARPLLRHRLDDAASVGARLLVAMSLGETIGVDDLSPVVEQETPSPSLVREYTTIREQSDRVASRLMHAQP